MSRTSAVVLRTQSDERLVALARAGHERAFEAIVRRYRRPLTAACRRVVDDGRDLRPWLFQIVRNAQSAIAAAHRSGDSGPTTAGPSGRTSNSTER